MIFYIKLKIEINLVEEEHISKKKMLIMQMKEIEDLIKDYEELMEKNQMLLEQILKEEQLYNNNKIIKDYNYKDNKLIIIILYFIKLYEYEYKYKI